MKSLVKNIVLRNHLLLNMEKAVRTTDVDVLGSGDAIPTDVLIWTSGVVGREVPGMPASSIGRGRRIMVDEFSKVRGTSNCYKYLKTNAMNDKIKGVLAVGVFIIICMLLLMSYSSQ